MAVARSTDQTLGVLFISLDQFKKVNDSLGHGPGDSLLNEFAKRLKSCISETDTVARFGNDEFALLRTHIEDTNDVINRASLVLKFAFDLSGNELLPLRASISSRRWRRQPDAAKMRGALYKAKRSGGANYQFYGNA